MLTSATDRLYPELMNNTTEASIFICLVNIGEGTPFISALELRPLSNSIYNQPGPSEALNTLYRYDVGSNGDNLNTSYLKDPYTRTWDELAPSLLPHSDFFSNNSIGALTNDAYSIPLVVLSTAAKPLSGYRSLSFTWSPNDIPRLPPVQVVQVYWHFAEIEKLGFNDSMEFNIFLGGNPLFGPIKLRHLEAQTFVSPTIYLNGSSLSFSINQTSSSTLPPILNALEIYSVIGLTKSPTNQEDVNAIMQVKAMYPCQVPRSWQGDPCLPVDPWDGLQCSSNNTPRILYLDLSSSSLEGDIPPSLSNLTALQYLNLSYNGLTGNIPEFLAQLPFLKIM
ncbi:hypothetical protein Ancab_017403 [Ancistrocladus abbreviatus]